MLNFTESSLRLLKRLLGNRSSISGQDKGTLEVVDGSGAVALTEAVISRAAAVGTGGSIETAAVVWRTEQRRRADDRLEHQITTLAAEGPRGSLATAAGLSLSGERSTVFLSGPEAVCAQDLLADIAGRHLPLVVHVESCATGGSSNMPGTGHEAAHLSAQSGCFLLYAANVQEVVDFTLVARRVAERTLLPGLVFMDGEQTAASFQQAALPSWQLIKAYLGQPDDLLPCSGLAEKLLFGDERRRVPRWHDIDRPVLLGAAQPAGLRGLGKAASRLFLEQDVTAVMSESMALLAERCGRQYAPVSSHRVDDADLLLLAMGAAIETAEAAADQLRAADKLKVGVLGIRVLRPFPKKLISEQLKRVRLVCVLERQDNTALSTDLPLLTELQAAVGHQAQNRTRLLSVRYGMGGLPLRAADLIELCRQAGQLRQSDVYLGMRLDQTNELHPKRQVLLDRLRRNYPNLTERGISAADSETDLAPEDAVCVAVQRISGSFGVGLAQDAADLIWQAGGGELRSRIAQSLVPWGESCSDWFCWAPGKLRDPGDRQLTDLTIFTTSVMDPLVPELRLKQKGSLLIENSLEIAHKLPAAIIEQLGRCGGQLFAIDTPIEKSADLRFELLLGAACAILLQRELMETSFRRLMSLRETVLSELPEEQRSHHLHAFKEGFEQLVKIDMALLTPMPISSAASDQAPQAVKRLGNVDDGYDSLPRFWDQTGVLFRNQTTARITPDPYLAINAIPPLSSAFRNFDGLRDALPELDAEACTGCGACWTLCPDGAIGVSLMDPAMLLETGVRMTGSDRLRPILSKLSISMLRRCREKGTPLTTAGELLHDTFDWLLQQSLPENHKQHAAEAKAKLIDALGEIQISLTEALFRVPESKSPGSGNILFLAINPATCKGCGICISNCEPNALTLEKHTPDLLAQAGRSWRIWEELPDTTEKTIELAGSQITMGKAAALLMSKVYRGTLIGGDGAEPGSGERLALRLALTAVESRQRPLINSFASEVDAVREKLAALIRKMLADALPADDLDALASGLESVDGRETDLSRFINDSEGAIATRIDALRLRRLVTLARQLRDLSWKLSSGRQGFGRAALGLVLNSNSPTGWAGVFPDNPFSLPVTVDSSGDAAQFGAGLLQGQLQQSLEGFVLMRKARLELENPADAARLWSSLEHLDWDHLEAEERALCPPVFIIGSNSLLAGRGLAQLSRILAGKLPLKVLLFADLDLGVASGADNGMMLAPIEDAGSDLALLTLSRRNSFNAQCSVGFTDHLMAAVQGALNCSGPALIQVHAPSPQRHGFATGQTIERARKAVQSRTFPLFIYDPQAEGVFGSRFSLEGNPDPTKGWFTDDDDRPLTSAGWALGEKRFRQWFVPLAADTADALPLDEFLALPEQARDIKKPFVLKSEDGGTAQRYQVTDPMVSICEERLQAWRALQEIAGLVTPFTKRIEQQAQEAVMAMHQDELRKMQAEYEARIANLQKEVLEQSRVEIRARLMAMAGYGSNSGESADAPH